MKNDEGKTIHEFKAKEGQSHISISEDGGMICTIDTENILYMYDITTPSPQLIEEIQLLSVPVMSLEWNTGLLYVNYNNAVTLFNAPQKKGSK